MTTISRKEVRQELAKILKGRMVSAQAVYSFQVANFGKASPVVYLTGSGSRRAKLTGRGYQSTFKINAHLFVLYASKDGSWTEENAEDTLDQLEFELAVAVLDVQGNKIISEINYSEASNADDPVVIGGETYLHEIVPLETTCFR